MNSEDKKIPRINESHEVEDSKKPPNKETNTPKNNSQDNEKPITTTDKKLKKFIDDLVAKKLQEERNKSQKQLQKCINAIKEVENDRDILQQRIDNQAKILKNNEQAIEKYKLGMEELKKELDNSDIQIKKLQDIIKAKDNYIDELNFTISGLDDTISGLNKKINELNEHYKQQEETIFTQDNIIKQLKSDMDEKVKRVLELEYMIDEKEKSFNETIKEKNNEIQNLEADIETNKVKIEELKDNVATKNTEITQLKDIIEQKNNLISQRDNLIKEKNNELQQMNSSLEEIKGKVKSFLEQVQNNLNNEDISVENIDDIGKLINYLNNSIITLKELKNQLTAHTQASENQLKTLQNDINKLEDKKRELITIVDSLEFKANFKGFLDKNTSVIERQAEIIEGTTGVIEKATGIFGSVEELASKSQKLDESINSINESSTLLNESINSINESSTLLNEKISNLDIGENIVQEIKSDFDLTMHQIKGNIETVATTAIVEMKQKEHNDRIIKFKDEEIERLEKGMNLFREHYEEELARNFQLNRKISEIEDEKERIQKDFQKTTDSAIAMRILGSTLKVSQQEFINMVADVTGSTYVKEISIIVNTYKAQPQLLINKICEAIGYNEELYEGLAKALSDGIHLMGSIVMPTLKDKMIVSDVTKLNQARDKKLLTYKDLVRNENGDFSIQVVESIDYSGMEKEMPILYDTVTRDINYTPLDLMYKHYSNHIEPLTLELDEDLRAISKTAKEYMYYLTNALIYSTLDFKIQEEHSVNPEFIALCEKHMTGVSKEIALESLGFIEENKYMEYMTMLELASRTKKVSNVRENVKLNLVGIMKNENGSDESKYKLDYKKIEGVYNTEQDIQMRFYELMDIIVDSQEVSGDVQSYTYFEVNNLVFLGTELAILTAKENI